MGNGKMLKTAFHGIVSGGKERIKEIKACILKGDKLKV